MLRNILTSVHRNVRTLNKQICVNYCQNQGPMGGENAKLSAKKARERADEATADKRRGGGGGSNELTWGYGRDRGPEKWWVYFPHAGGDRQSPIDIKPEEAIMDSQLKEVQVRCDTEPMLRVRIKNTGHSWQVDLSDKNACVSGGPADKQMYLLEQFHMHWGEENHCGSEHTLKGEHFAGELHFVYRNSAYESFEKALDKPDGLLVTGVWLQLDDSGKSEGMELLDILTKCCEDIPHKDDSVEIPVPVNTLCLVPENLQDYWTYPGSLTNPPCLESVTWLMFRQPLPVTPAQLARCRTMHSHTRGATCIQYNDDDFGRILKCARPVQPLGNRVLRTPGDRYRAADVIDTAEKNKSYASTLQSQVASDSARGGGDVVGEGAEMNGSENEKLENANQENDNCRVT